MTRYAALLRGVSPMNAKNAHLREAFETAGFEGVSTVLSSGNVVFDTDQEEDELEAVIEAAIDERLGRSFLTIVRSQDHLRRLLESNPYTSHHIPDSAKRVVTFLRTACHDVQTPLVEEGVHVVAVQGREVFTAYVRHPKGAIFMRFLEKQFGADQTTRTWSTVTKVARA